MTAIKAGRWGLTFGREFFRPCCESWGTWENGYHYAQAFGVTVWHDTLRPTTVGERGVW